jgi:hypothetical protein
MIFDHFSYQIRPTRSVEFQISLQASCLQVLFPPDFKSIVDIRVSATVCTKSMLGRWFNVSKTVVGARLKSSLPRAGHPAIRYFRNTCGAACVIGGVSIWVWSDTVHALKSEKGWMAGLEAPPARLQRHTTTDDDESHSEALPIPTRYYPFIIIAHPKAVVAQSALSVLSEIEPNAEVLVVADRYNFDDSNGSRLYTGSILSRRSDAIEGRQMITSFTASKSKFDEKLSRAHQLSATNSKSVTVCADAHVVLLDVENKVQSMYPIGHRPPPLYPRFSALRAAHFPCVSWSRLHCAAAPARSSYVG